MVFSCLVEWVVNGNPDTPKQFLILGKSPIIIQ